MWIDTPFTKAYTGAKPLVNKAFSPFHPQYVSDRLRTAARRLRNDVSKFNALRESPRLARDLLVVMQPTGEEPMSMTDASHAGALLEIDLGAIRANYRLLRARLGTTAAAGVVKADAYGLGAARVAPALADEGCRIFFVAHLDEAIALRAAAPRRRRGPRAQRPPAGAEAEAWRPASFPVLNSLGQLDAWGDAARRRPAAPAGGAAGRQRHVAARPAAGGSRALAPTRPPSTASTFALS